MKHFKKTIFTFLIIATFSVTQITTVFAYYDRVCDLTSAELYDEVWNMYYFDNFQSFEDEENEVLALEASITRYELKNFLADYEPINRDVNVSDVEKEYYQCLQDVVFKDIDMAVDEDGNIYEYLKSNPDEKHYWTYDESSDKFVCSNAENKIIKTYDRYYADKNTSAKPTKKNSNNSNSGSKASTPTVTKSKAASGTTTSVSEPTDTNSATVDTTDTENMNSAGMSTTQIIILSVIGSLIVGGIIFIIYTAVKKKKGK